MLEIFAYAIGVMYTPGPVNLLGLNGGLQSNTKRYLGFFAGVGTAMFILFVSISWAGKTLIPTQWLPYVALIGCSYILYIAWKLHTSDVSSLNVGDKPLKILSFKDGVLIQLLNPKAPAVVLPVAAVQFPASGIVGMEAVLWSGILAVLAFGAPTSYSILGEVLGHKLKNPKVFSAFNRILAWLLVAVAFSLGFETIYIPK
ncbi:transporter [Vibrio sp. vnigr-6D03]|uniref:LysE family translocator n=1 Tax=Vibrio sp. vnigr-6D03 TaxID=2058088 RepID=UPI000C348533|nr:LysE family transporter [Vibrio sp. vnigr-6D03]PKF79835.1 transporter [Vibrio sp. vnigr-6D03]